MAIALNDKALKRAKELIEGGSVADDRRDNWSEHAPSTEDENKLIEQKGMDEFARWHLGIEQGADKDNKGTYSFPFGDFQKVHRGAVIAAKVRAAQYDHKAIKEAANELLQMIDK